jgi:putative transposase
MISYKCQLVGIKVIIQEESYTSVANFLNDDPLPVYGQITEKQVFSGKRIKRGLYRTDRGFLCQSDVMGSYNIWLFVTWYGSIGEHKSTKSLSGKRLN